MDRPLINVMVSLVIFLVMFYQVWHTPAGSYKRHAFIAAGIAFGLLALFNGKVLLHGDSGTWAIVMIWIAFLLLFTSVILLFFAWRAGEMQGQIEQARQALEQQRERHTAEKPAEKEQTGKPDEPSHSSE